MSVFGKIPVAIEKVKDFDREKPFVSVETDKVLTIENYKKIRLFTDTEIGVDFDGFVLTVEGRGLVMESFTPDMIKISGRITSLNYLEG